MTKKQLPDKPKLEYYSVKIDAWSPCEITFRVLAASPEEALDLVDKKARQVQVVSISPHQLGSLKKIKARIFLFGSSMLKYIKNYG